MMKWFKKIVVTKESLIQDATEEALLIERDVLNRELANIQEQHGIQARRAQLDFLAAWLSQHGNTSLEKNFDPIASSASVSPVVFPGCKHQ